MNRAIAHLEICDLQDQDTASTELIFSTLSIFEQITQAQYLGFEIFKEFEYQKSSFDYKLNSKTFNFEIDYFGTSKDFDDYVKKIKSDILNPISFIFKVTINTKKNTLNIENKLHGFETPIASTPKQNWKAYILIKKD